MKGLQFEFVKNVSGEVVKLAFALGLRINGNIFLKSIASTGSVHVCLLVDDDLDEVDGGKKKIWMIFMSCRQIQIT